MNIPPKASIILPLEKPPTAEKMQRLRSSKVGWVEDLEHSVRIFFCSSEKQWNQMSVNTEDRNRVWRIIFKLLTIQIFISLIFFATSQSWRGCLPVDIEERRWKSSEQIRETLIANPLQIHWASKQASKQAITEAARSQRDYIRIASGAADSFALFHRNLLVSQKGK